MTIDNNIDTQTENSSGIKWYGDIITTSVCNDTKKNEQEVDEKTNSSFHSPLADSNVENKKEVNWLDNVSEVYRDVVDKFADINELAKAYMNAQCLIGKKVSDFKKLDPQSYKDVVEHFGGISVPNQPEEYQFFDDDELDEGTIPNYFKDDKLDSFKQFAFENKLSNDQAQGVLDLLNNQVVSMTSALQQEKENKTNENMKVLKELWGDEHNIQAKLGSVKSFISKFVAPTLNVEPEVVEEDFIKAGVHENAFMLHLFSKLGELTQEGQPGGRYNLAPIDSHNRLEMLRNDPEWRKALVNKYHPKHKEVAEEHRQLIQMSQIS